jgi:HD-GYP domain-containing protein (c-di-GMP phosphodiesterase class II)
MMGDEKKDTTSIKLLNLTVKSAVWLTGAECGFSTFISRRGQKIFLYLLTSDGQEKNFVFYPPLSMEVAYWAGDCHEPRLITEADKAIYWMLKHKIEFEIGSVLCAPFKVRGRTIGLTGLIAKQGSREPDVRDVGLLSLLNERDATRLENRLLLRAFANYRARLRSLREAEGILMAARSPKEIFRISAQAAADITDAQASSLLMVDRENRELVFEAATGEKSDELIKSRIPLGEGIAGWAALQGEPLLVPDVSKDPRFYKKVDEATGFVTRSILCVPLKSRDKVIGVVEVLNKRGGLSFTKRDVQLLTALARQAASAIENYRLYFEAIKAFAAAIDSKASYTRGHSERVMESSELIAEEMGLPEEEKENVKIASLLHDAGKVGIDESIIKKPSQLTGEEYAKMKEHVLMGYDTVKNIEQIEGALTGILDHHENYDGSGYPRGLKGEDISIVGRIVHVAEAYDAMISDRPYRRGLEIEAALEVIAKSAGTEFDPSVVQAFVAAHGRLKGEGQKE